MKLLGNSLRDISSLQKWLLYRCCILPIALYGFQLWYYNKAPLSYHMKILDKMQRRAVIWILGAFKTSPSMGIKAIAGIIPIKFYLRKIARRSEIHPFKLLSGHLLRSLMDDLPPSSSTPNSHCIGTLTNRQRNLTKGHLIDSYNKAHGIFPSFSPLNPEFPPGCHITDEFSNCFSFNLVNKKEKEKYRTCAQELDDMVLSNSSSPQSALIIMDTSIKNDIAISVLHIHIANHPLTKTVYHASFVASTEVKLFAIRCGINQACSIDSISKIIVITNSIYAAKKIFDSESHPYQLHSVAILIELWRFFNSNLNNSIEFWECPSCLKWGLHLNTDKDSKSFLPTPSYPFKISWDYCKKINSDKSINLWKMMFQASDGKGNNFLDLLDNDYNSIEPSYIKGGPWLQAFGHSNSLCTQATRAITNHTPIGEYWLRFFPNLDFSCPCNNYSIKSRRHILHECTRFNRYWNPRRDSLNHFVMFLIANPNAFTFLDN